MRILIADDHELLRGAVKSLLANAFEGARIAEAASLDAALERLAEEDRDLVILDLNMPGVSGMDSIRAFCEAFPQSRVAILSASEDRRDVMEALDAGAHGYVPKSFRSADIIAALSDIAAGRIFVPAAIVRPHEAPLRRRPALPQGADNLTERQREVLDELLRGKSSKEIARTLDIAEGTVKIHLAAIYRALGVRSRAEAIAKAGGLR